MAANTNFDNRRDDYENAFGELCGTILQAKVLSKPYDQALEKSLLYLSEQLKDNVADTIKEMAENEGSEQLIEKAKTAARKWKSTGILSDYYGFN